MNYKGFIFDLDDTLYREHDYVKSGFLAVAKELGSFTSISQHTIYEMLVNEWQFSGRGSVFNVICEQLKINIDIQTLIKTYRTHTPNLDLYDDALYVLKDLKDRQAKLALITDGNSEMQWAKIRALNIESLFDAIIVTGDLGNEYWKPHELPYKLVTEKIGLNLKECVYIGDNPNKDFITAKKLGMGTIRIIRHTGDHMKISLSEEYEADRTIYSLYDLIKD